LGWPAAGPAGRLPRGGRRSVSVADIRSGRLHGKTRGSVRRFDGENGDRRASGNGGLHNVNRQRCGVEGVFLTDGNGTSDPGGTGMRKVTVWLGALCFAMVPTIAQTPAQRQYQYAFQNPNLSIEDRVTNIVRVQISCLTAFCILKTLGITR